MNDMGGGGGGGGAGGFDGERPLTVTSVLKEFQGLKDKFKNEDEDDCELSSRDEGGDQRAGALPGHATFDYRPGAGRNLDVSAVHCL